MQKLNLPIYSIKLKKEHNKTFVFDPIRKKYLILTPEEWVRQNFIQFLIKKTRSEKNLDRVPKEENNFSVFETC